MKFSTVKEIAGLPVGNHADTKQAGLRVVVYQSGVRSFVARLRAADGQTRTLTLGHTKDLSLEQARMKVAELRQDRKTAPDPILARRQAFEAALTSQRKAEAAKREGQKQDALTLRVLCCQFLDQHPLRANTMRDYRGAFDREFLPKLGNTPVAKITAEQVEAIIEKKAKVHPTTARRSLAAIGSMFSWAVRKKLVASNPVAGIVRPPNGEPRSRTLTAAEIRLVLNAMESINPDFAKPIEVILRTGQRPIEVFAMTHEEIHGDRWVIPAGRYKTGSAHTVPLVRQVLELIGEGTGYVFPRRRRDGVVGHVRTDSALKLLQQCCKDAGLKPTGLHDLRRTFESRAVDTLRLPADLVHYDIAGHQRGGVEKAYLRLERYADAMQALCQWNDWLDGLSPCTRGPLA